MGPRIMSSDKLLRFGNAFEWLLSTDGRMAVIQECGPTELSLPHTLCLYLLPGVRPNEIFLMVQDTDYISMDFNMSRTYCSWINNVFNSLICNLFKNIDLCMFCMRAQFGAYWPSGCRDLRGGGPQGSRQTLTTPHLLTFLTLWPQRPSKHIYYGFNVLYERCSHTFTGTGKEFKQFCLSKSASERAPFEYRSYAFPSKTRPSNCHSTEWRANLFLLSYYLHFSSLCRVLLLWLCSVFPFPFYLPFIHANTQRQGLFIYSQTRWYQAHSWGKSDEMRSILWTDVINIVT